MVKSTLNSLLGHNSENLFKSVNLHLINESFHGNKKVMWSD